MKSYFHVHYKGNNEHCQHEHRVEYHISLTTRYHPVSRQFLHESVDYSIYLNIRNIEYKKQWSQACGWPKINIRNKLKKQTFGQ